jgi:predicted ester cyclase
MNRIILVIAAMTTIVIGPSFAKDQKTESNKAIVRKVFVDILSQGKYEVTNEIYAQDFVNHETTKDIGRDADEANNRGWRAAFPDLDLNVKREIAEGDFVTVLWEAQGTNTGSGNGLNATGRKTQGRGISVFRVVDGRIKEEWTEFSQLLVLQQLGLAPKQP